MLNCTRTNCFRSICNASPSSTYPIKCENDIQTNTCGCADDTCYDTVRIRNGKMTGIFATRTRTKCKLEIPYLSVVIGTKQIQIISFSPWENLNRYDKFFKENISVSSRLITSLYQTDQAKLTINNLNDTNTKRQIIPDTIPEESRYLRDSQSTKKRIRKVKNASRR